VIRHQDIGVEKKTVEFLIMGQLILILPIIRVTSKNHLPLIAAGNHMVKRTRKMNARRSGHERPRIDGVRHIY